MSSADDKKTTWFRLFRADCANANKTYTKMYIHKTERQKKKIIYAFISYRGRIWCHLVA